MPTFAYIGEILPYAGSQITKNGMGCAVAACVEKKKGKRRR
ncbi:hypothetical protein [Halobacillus litoralis]